MLKINIKSEKFFRLQKYFEIIGINNLDYPTYMNFLIFYFMF